MHAACTNDHSHWPLYQVQLGPKIVSALWYIEGLDFRGSFYTDLMEKHSGPTKLSALSWVYTFQKCPEWEVPLYGLCFSQML